MEQIPDWESLIAERSRPCATMCPTEDAKKNNSIRRIKDWHKRHPNYNAKYYADQAETVAESIPEDYSELSADVGSLKSAICDYKADATLWQQGTINASTGANADSTTRIRTTAVLPANIGGFKTASGYSALIYAFNGSTYVGNWNGSSFIKSTSGNVWFTNAVFASINKSYTYKLVMRNDSNASVTPTDASNVQFVYFTDPALEKAGRAADAKVVGDKLTALDSTATKTAFPYDFGATWSQGGVNSSGEYSSWARIRTDYLSIDGLGQLTFTPASGYSVSVGVYDTSKNVTRFTLWSTESITVTITDKEKYIRLCLMTSPEANLSPSAGKNLTATALYKVTKEASEVSDAVRKMDSISIADFIWEIGGISGGEDTNVTTAIRTKYYYDVSNFGRLVANADTGYKYTINIYDKTKTHLFTLSPAGYVSGENIVEMDDVIGYIRVMLSTDEGSTLSDTSISEHFTLNADWKATGEIKNIGNSEVNLLEEVEWVRGTLDGDGDFAESTSRAVTNDYISVSGFRSLRFHTIIDTVRFMVVFYGDDGKITETGYASKDLEIQVPANAIKIKIIMVTTPDAYLGNAKIGKTLKLYGGTAYDSINDGNLLADDYFCATCVNKKEIPALASGTTVIAFGDSITAEQTSAGWVYHFSAMTGCTIVDKAVGGSSFGHSETEDSGHWISTQISNTTDATWETVDLVIVAAGTNDYGHGTPLDEIKEYVQDAIDSIKAKTDAPIVFITPIRRGLYLYADAMKKLPLISGIIANVALANQCNVIRGFDIPIPTYNVDGLIDDMTRDGLHPVATGANAYARFIVGKLM